MDAVQMRILTVLAIFTAQPWTYKLGMSDLANRISDCSGFAYLFSSMLGAETKRVSTKEYYEWANSSRVRADFPHIVVVRNKEDNAGHCGVRISPTLIVDVSSVNPKPNALGLHEYEVWLYNQLKWSQGKTERYYDFL